MTITTDKDITDTHLAAAIIDQKVAGAFHDKLYAYTSVIADKGWALGVAVANEKGYCPVGGKTFATDDEARVWADGLNKHIGLTRTRVMEIIVSSMGGRRVEVSR